ncbi:MAG: multiheme c-type cytochrome [Planctomycetota bacterium]
MTRPRTSFALRASLLLVLGGSFTLGTLRSVLGEDPAPPGLDPAQTLGPDTQQSEQQGCIKCHEPHYAAWRKSTHAGSLAMPREPLARSLRRALRRQADGFRPNTSPLCMSCHFTVIESKGELKAAYGVSCESCHGAGGAHVALHSDKQADYATRMQAATDAGMIRPTSLYRLAENCYQCHMLAKDVNRAEGEPTLEELVNLEVEVKEKGQESTVHHPAGTLEFDLLTYSQGEVRHNFNDGKPNPPSAYRHALYVVGKLLDLEFSLRALARATDAEGTYYTSIRSRLEGERGAPAALRAVRGVLPDDLPLAQTIDGCLEALGTTDLGVEKHDATLAAAEKVRELAQQAFPERSPEELAEFEAKLAAVPGLTALLPTEVKGEADGGGK